jgi:hypothetical protein
LSQGTCSYKGKVTQATSHIRGARDNETVVAKRSELGGAEDRRAGDDVVVDERQVVRRDGQHLGNDGDEGGAVHDRVEGGGLEDGAVGLDRGPGVRSGDGQGGVSGVKLVDPWRR